MKKSLIIIVTFFIIILLIIALNYKNYDIEKINIENFNKEYEQYNSENLNGLDITTIINKAISNNEKNEITKDNNGMYKLDDKYSIEIYVSMVNGENAYPMEKFIQADLNDFIRYFGEVGFKCTDVKYHKETGRVASMTFEIKEY